VGGVISFDREIYHPGDTVEVTFSDISNDHSRLNQVELQVFAYEEIKVTYQSGKQTRTAREQIDYVLESTILQESQASGTHTITCQLPSEMPTTASYDGNGLDISVVLGAGIKYDISLGFDDHVKSYAEVIAPAHRQVESIAFEQDGLSVALGNNLIHTGQEITITVQPTSEFDANYRGIRLEVEEIFEGTAKGKSKRRTNNRVLWSADHLPPSEKIRFGFPQLPFYTNVGSQFAIDQVLKLVIDRKFQRDNNLELPIVYSDFNDGRASAGDQGNASAEKNNDKKIYDQSVHDENQESMYGFSSKAKEITCRGCGNAVTRSAKKCPKCGTKVTV